MAAGWLRGKRYSGLQVGSVALLTVGVCVSGWADAVNKVCFPAATLGPFLSLQSSLTIHILSHDLVRRRTPKATSTALTMP